MTTPILVCTLASTYYGLEDLFGTSEFAYNDGIVSYFGWTLPSLVIYVFAAFALSKRLRRENFISLHQILERYYGRDAGILGAVASFAYEIPALSLFALGRICEVTLGELNLFGLMLPNESSSPKLVFENSHGDQSKPIPGQSHVALAPGRSPARNVGHGPVC